MATCPLQMTIDISDQTIEDTFDKYLVHIPHRASFVFNSNNGDKMEVEDKIWKQKQGEDEEVNDQKPACQEKQGGEMSKRKEKMNGEPMVQEEEGMVVEEMEDMDAKQARFWFCNKNDGKRRNCRNIVDRPKTLCDYHLAKSRSYYTCSSETVAAANSKSSRTKATTIAKSALRKSSSKPTPAGAASSLMAASSSAQNNSKAATSSVSVPTSSQLYKRKAGIGLGGDDYYFYDLFVPFYTKERGGSSNHRVTTVDADEKDLPHDNAITIEEKDDKKQYNNDLDNLSDDSSISSGDDESDEDYSVGGARKPYARKETVKLAVDKVQFSKTMKKRVKERSLKSLL
ncbi:hypothetical protein E2562_024986 [Oryza meyeriana var. granulata]|uniref:WRC domain-containing protein n=1 Tax=Oryza meyeriana var. granulata TaxID=110450 RepID=A0A6G1FBS3_9ORYZ|nr:hypothetical protein E2562_024986 [Oryza meyeriana var. granulata]